MPGLRDRQLLAAEVHVVGLKEERAGVRRPVILVAVMEVAVVNNNRVGSRRCCNCVGGRGYPVGVGGGVDVGLVGSE